jgi:hypothetical protein
MGDRMDVRMPEVPLEEAAAIVAGGIRFAVQNGFRLPAHYQRWTTFLGGKLDWQHADLSAFGVEGGAKLRWVAPMEDLRARLIGSTVEQFLARPDVEFIDIIEAGYLPAKLDEEWDEAYEDEEDYDDEEEDDLASGGDPAFGRPHLEDAEVISATDRPTVDPTPQPGANKSGAKSQAALPSPGTPVTEPTDADREREEGDRAFLGMTLNLIAAVDSWCFNEGLVPSRQLAKAAAFMLASGAISSGGSGDEDPDEIMEHLMQTVPDEEVCDLDIGLQQVERFVSSYRSPAALVAALQAGERRVTQNAQKAGGHSARPA